MKSMLIKHRSISLCGGSQKAVSAPPGLTFVTISDEAKKVMENRKTPIASFYCNLTIFKDYYKIYGSHIQCQSVISMD